MKVSDIYDTNNIKSGVTIFCPGCECLHMIDDRWTFNQDYNNPTFTPSLLVTSPYGYKGENRRCHSFITDGKIQFLSDCTHQYAGQTLELGDAEDW